MKKIQNNFNPNQLDRSNVQHIIECLGTLFNVTGFVSNELKRLEQEGWHNTKAISHVKESLRTIFAVNENTQDYLDNLNKDI